MRMIGLLLGCVMLFSSPAAMAATGDVQVFTNTSCSGSVCTETTLTIVEMADGTFVSSISRRTFIRTSMPQK